MFRWLKPKMNLFISDIDQFLIDFDFKNPHQSLSQQQEINKALKIRQLRDGDSKEVD